jgi:hypothetical protein
LVDILRSACTPPISNVSCELSLSARRGSWCSPCP